MTPKKGNSTERDQNVISSEGDQDTSSCQNFRPFLLCVLKKMSGSCKFGLLSQNDSKMRKIKDDDPNLISSEGGQDTSACKILGHSKRLQ